MAEAKLLTVAEIDAIEVTPTAIRPSLEVARVEIDAHVAQSLARMARGMAVLRERDWSVVAHNEHSGGRGWFTESRDGDALSGDDASPVEAIESAEAATKPASPKEGV